MITTIITLFILLAVFALVYWGVNALALPQPLKVVIIVIMGLVGLLFVYHLFVGGDVGTLRLR